MTQMNVMPQLYPLRADEVDIAKRLCDECVGKDLYSAEELTASIDARQCFFYLLKAKSGEAVGYIYFRITDAQQIAADGKQNISTIRGLCRQKMGSVGKIQSIGLTQPYRKSGYGKYMIDFALEKFKSLHVEQVFIICWKKGDDVPLRSTLMQCDFLFLSTAKMVWFDHPRLHCPYCAGRCRCDAEIYYKILD